MQSTPPRRQTSAAHDVIVGGFPTRPKRRTPRSLTTVRSTSQLRHSDQNETRDKKSGMLFVSRLVFLCIPHLLQCALWAARLVGDPLTRSLTTSWTCPGSNQLHLELAASILVRPTDTPRPVLYNTVCALFFCFWADMAQCTYVILNIYHTRAINTTHPGKPRNATWHVLEGYLLKGFTPSVVRVPRNDVPETCSF